jgi:hypothetical protein
VALSFFCNVHSPRPLGDFGHLPRRQVERPVSGTITEHVASNLVLVGGNRVISVIVFHSVSPHQIRYVYQVYFFEKWCFFHLFFYMFALMFRMCLA